MAPELTPVLDEMRARVQAAVAGPDGRALRLRPSPLVIGRVCDDEPLLRTEVAVARLAPDRLLRGLAAAGLLSGADRIALAVDEEEPELIASLARQAAGGRAEIWPVAPLAPLDGDSLCADLAARRGRSLSASGLQRASVLSAVVLSDLCMALEGRTPLYRSLTVAGLVDRPAVLSAALGTRIGELVRAAGGSPDPAWVAFHNGVVGGEPVDAEQPVELHTRGVVVLPHDHPLLLRRTVPVDDEARRAASACVRCRVCSDGCTAHLLGAALQPHAILQAVSASFGESALDPSPPLLSALECRRCGLCTTSCPSGLRPAEVVSSVRARLAAQGVQLAASAPLQPHADRPGRRLSRARLAERLGLGPFDAPVERHAVVLPANVRVPARAPGGTARVPVVRAGEAVSPGDLLALAPAGSGELDCRSPAAGTVIGVDPDDGITVAVR